MQKIDEIEQLKSDLSMYHSFYQDASVMEEWILMGVYLTKMEDCKKRLDELGAKIDI